MIRLETSRLTVDIAEPGSAYRRSRFDWTGFVTQVTLDGRHTFCVPEAIDGTGTGGDGLCNEFGINHPIGYRGTPPGETFPKIGVGLLTRPDRHAYQFHRPYEITPFPMSAKADRRRATLVVEPLDCRGYAVRLEKTVQVDEARLSIEYQLSNTGTRPIRTDEYAHNFVAINGHRLGPDYVLKLPFHPDARAVAEPLVATDSTLSWKAPGPRQSFFQMFPDPRPLRHHSWELIHLPSGVGVRETTDVPWLRFHVFGTQRLVSPEVFVPVRAAPGKTLAWRRDYEFFS